MQDRSLSSCAVVWQIVTSCIGKLKAPQWSKNHLNWSGKCKDFSKPIRKGDQWTILLCVGGKNWAADLNFGKKTASHSRSFETAVSSLDFVYRKLQQIQDELHVGPDDDKWKDLDWSEWFDCTGDGFVNIKLHTTVHEIPHYVVSCFIQTLRLLGLCQFTHSGH